MTRLQRAAQAVIDAIDVQECDAIAELKRAVEEDRIYFATTRWAAEDVQSIRPDWNLERCERELGIIERRFQDWLVELGWGCHGGFDSTMRSMKTMVTRRQNMRPLRFDWNQGLWAYDCDGDDPRGVGTKSGLYYLSAEVEPLIEATKQVLEWRNFDGDGISDPTRQNLIAALAPFPWEK